MRVSDLYPMLSRLPILQYKVAKVIPLNRVLAIPEARMYAKEVLRRFSPGEHVFYFKNIDVYIPDGGSWGDLAVLYSKLINGEGPWAVSVVDPNWLSQSINNTGTQAMISGLGLTQPYDIMYPDIFKALLGEGDVTPFLWKSGDTQVVQESLEQDVCNLIRMDEAVLSFTKETAAALSKSKVEPITRGSLDDLRDYLLEPPGAGTGGDPQVPLLIGHTGASKSAVLKSMVDTLFTKWGLRLIDVRVSFIEKSDVVGFMEVVKTPEGKGYQPCPMKDLVVASDQFLATVRNFLNRPDVLKMQQGIFQEKEHESAEEKEKKEPDRKVIDALTDLAKTPVLVFEEINRSGQAIRQMLTPLLNQKEFQGMTLKEARIVATANKAISDDPDKAKELNDMRYYDAEGFKDFAYKSRFIFIDIIPNPDTSDHKTSKGKDTSFRQSFIYWAAGPPYPYQVVVVKDLDEKTGEWKGTETLAVVVGPGNLGESNQDHPEQDTMSYYVAPVGPVDDEKVRDEILNDPRAVIKYHDSKNIRDVPRSSIQHFDLRTGVRKPVRKEYNLCDEVMEFLSAADKDGKFLNMKHLYNMSKVEELSKKFNSSSAPPGVDEKVIKSTPVTSFRTWEYMTKLIRYMKKIGKKDLLEPVLKGIMDPSTYDAFIAFMAKKGWKVISSDNPLSDSLDICMSTGLPLLMQSGASAGKTTRVAEKVERMEREPGSKGVEFFKIDLSSKTRLDIKGRPTPINMVDSCFPAWTHSKSPIFSHFKKFYGGKLYDVGDMVSYQVRPHNDKGNVFKVLALRDEGKVEIQEYDGARDSTGIMRYHPVAEPILVSETLLKKKSALPEKTTEFLPQEAFQERVRNAVARGKKLVIFADEINRVSDPVVTTSIFEAISDRRFMGVELPPELDLSVVAACNLGSLFPDAKALDPAVIARFVTIKDEQDEKVYKSCIEWMKQKASQGKFVKALATACEKMGYEDFAKMFFPKGPDEAAAAGTNDVDSIINQEDVQCATTRCLEDLSNRMMGNSIGAPIKGRKLGINKDFFSQKLRSAKSTSEFFSGWLGNGFDKIVSHTLQTDSNMEPIQTSNQDIFDTVDDYIKRRDAKQLSAEEQGNIESSLCDIVAHTELSIDEYREKAIRSRLRGADPDSVTNFISAYKTAADTSIEFSDLRDTTLVKDFLMDQYTGKTLTQAFASLIFGHFSAAVSTFKYSAPIDYARWFIAMAEFLSDVKKTNEFSEIVKLCYLNSDIKKVLEGIDYDEVKKLADAGIKSKIRGAV